MSTATIATKTVISCDEALRIAHADALAAYRILDQYKITIVLSADGWQVDYELHDVNRQGGGPHYLIDLRTGHIISKRYEQ